MRHKILLVGIISNVASTIEKELRIVLSALSSFKEINIFLVESDSTDCTLEVLGKLQRLDPRIEVISKGHLSQQLPNRIQRIAYCREIYVEFIKMNYKNKKWEYVAVADLDGMNFKLSKKGVESCFDSNIEWDGMMANQRFGYFDIYALRAAGWVENDCFLELKNLKESTTQPKIGKSKAINFIRLFLYFDNLRKVTIYKKMKILRKRNGFVPVKSAFGGFAIYKTKVFLDSSYESNNYNQSEHVNFHLLNSSKNKRFFINPSLINSNLNVYNLNKIRLIRFLREIKKYLNF